MAAMERLRFALVLVLAVALDFAPPLPSEGSEALEEFGGSAGRRPLLQRLLRDTRPPLLANTAVKSAAQRRPPTPAPGRRPAFIAFAPKQPAAIAESALAPEDH